MEGWVEQSKKVASGDMEDIEVVSAQTTHTPDNGTTNPFTMANGERINKPKSQLRQVITDWMTVTRGCRTTVSDMWQAKTHPTSTLSLPMQSYGEPYPRGVYTDRYMCSASGFLRS